MRLPRSSRMRTSGEAAWRASGPVDELRVRPGAHRGGPGIGAERAEQRGAPLRRNGGRALGDQLAQHRAQAAAAGEAVEELADPVRHADLVEETGEQLARDQVEHLAAEQEVVLMLASVEQTAVEFAVAVGARLEAERGWPVDQQPAQVHVDHLGGQAALGAQALRLLRRRLARGQRAGERERVRVGLRAVAGVLAQMLDTLRGRHADDRAAHPCALGKMQRHRQDLAPGMGGEDPDRIVAAAVLCAHVVARLHSWINLENTRIGEVCCSRGRMCIDGARRRYEEARACIAAHAPESATVLESAA